MAQSVLFFAVLCAFVAVNLGHKSEKFIGNAVHPDYPGQCYYKEEEAAIPVGDKYTLKKACEEAECRTDFVLRFDTCPEYGNLKPGCKLTEDKNAVYPRCCPTIKCPK